MKCPHCLEEVRNGVTKCPHCTGNISLMHSAIDVFAGCLTMVLMTAGAIWVLMKMFGGK